MGSSFLTAINLVLAIYCVIMFVKMLIQFGLPNHPGRFILYLVSLCVTSYFVIKAATDLSLVDPLKFMRWRALPLVAGGLGLLLQVITCVGQFSLIQQKIISRIPLMAALLALAFFDAYADYFLIGSLLATVLFLSISVGKARYQKRMLFKMNLFLGFVWVGILTTYSAYVVTQLFLFPALFYFFIFQQSYGVSTIIDRHQDENFGVPT